MKTFATTQNTIQKTSVAVFIITQYLLNTRFIILVFWGNIHFEWGKALSSLGTLRPNFNQQGLGKRVAEYT